MGGLHGANRLGGNSLAEILVFGKLAGYSASSYSKKLRSMKRSPELLKNYIDKFKRKNKKGERTCYSNSK